MSPILLYFHSRCWFSAKHRDGSRFLSNCSYLLLVVTSDGASARTTYQQVGHQAVDSGAHRLQEFIKDTPGEPIEIGQLLLPSGSHRSHQKPTWCTASQRRHSLPHSPRWPPQTVQPAYCLHNPEWGPQEHFSVNSVPYIANPWKHHQQQQRSEAEKADMNLECMCVKKNKTETLKMK